MLWFLFVYFFTRMLYLFLLPFEFARLQKNQGTIFDSGQIPIKQTSKQTSQPINVSNCTHLFYSFPFLFEKEGQRKPMSKKLYFLTFIVSSFFRSYCCSYYLPLFTFYIILSDTYVFFSCFFFQFVCFPC